MSPLDNAAPQTQTQPVLARVAELARGTYRAELPEDVVHGAKRCLIDWLGVAIAGMNETPTRKLRAALKAGHTDNGSAYARALTLGTASHALDYDDTDYINLIHVSSTLFPAL